MQEGLGLPRFWVSIRSYKKQPVKKIGVEYWALHGSNWLWRPCYVRHYFIFLTKFCP